MPGSRPWRTGPTVPFADTWNAGDLSAFCGWDKPGPSQLVAVPGPSFASRMSSKVPMEGHPLIRVKERALMSISSVGSAGSGTDLAELQRQLQTDEKALAADEAQRAPATALTAAELLVTTDEQAIATANNAQAKAVSSSPGPSTASNVKSTGNAVNLQA